MQSAPRLSLIIPTRERAAYLPYCIGTCTANTAASLEIIVLDNASTDDTEQVAAQFTDPRIRYVRNASRLSMRDNFEKGLDLARGEIVGFIGDDDGVLPFTVDKVLAMFDTFDVQAVSAARAHYFWPDLRSSRRNTALVPRTGGVEVLDSREQLRHVLKDCDYYRLPCLYHGFVKRSLVDTVRTRQGRMFLSSQVDMYSAISLSMEGVKYLRAGAPLVINGGSSRSNGASHFGGGTTTEKSMWKQEDDIGFLDGFTDSVTVGSLILESGLRYCAGRDDGTALADLFAPAEIASTIEREMHARTTAGRASGAAEKVLTDLLAGYDLLPPAPSRRPDSRLARLAASYRRTCPVDMTQLHIADVYAASRAIEWMIENRETGLLRHPLRQFRTALRIARG